jgi:hypothetical protein
MLDQIIGVAHHVLERRVGAHAPVGTQEAGGEVQPHHAAAFADRGELPVGQVARVLAERMEYFTLQYNSCCHYATSYTQGTCFGQSKVIGSPGG